MTNRPGNPPTPALYAGLMAVAGLAALAAALTLAGMMGGSARTASLSLVCVAVGSLSSLAPALFGPRVEIGNWGLLVVAASIARTLLMLVLGLIVAPASGPESSPYWLSLASGAGILLVAESAVSIGILTRLDHLRTARATEHVHA